MSKKKDVSPMAMNVCCSDRENHGPAVEEVNDVEWLQSQVSHLFQIIDDIDTGSDMFKPCNLDSYRAFYNYTMRKQKIRWEGLTSDGYKIYRR